MTEHDPDSRRRPRAEAARPAPRSLAAILLSVAELPLIPITAYSGMLYFEMLGCRVLKRSCYDLQALPWILLGVVVGFALGIAWCVKSWRMKERMQRRALVDLGLIALAVAPFVASRL